MLTPYRPKALTNPRREYHLAMLRQAVAIDGNDAVKLHAVRCCLIALETMRIQAMGRVALDQAIAKIFSDYGLSIPPSLVGNDHDDS